MNVIVPVVPLKSPLPKSNPEFAPVDVRLTVGVPDPAAPLVFDATAPIPLEFRHTLTYPPKSSAAFGLVNDTVIVPVAVAVAVQVRK